MLKNFIVFAEKDEELNKYIQHQTGAVQKVMGRALDHSRKRGLVWHTQGSGKTYTMIKVTFVEYPNWQKSDNSLRELRKKVTFAIYARSNDPDKVSGLVDELFTLLERAGRI